MINFLLDLSLVLLSMVFFQLFDSPLAKILAGGALLGFSTLIWIQLKNELYK